MDNSHHFGSAANIDFTADVALDEFRSHRGRGRGVHNHNNNNRRRGHANQLFWNLRDGPTNRENFKLRNDRPLDLPPLMPDYPSMDHFGRGRGPQFPLSFHDGYRELPSSDYDGFDNFPPQPLLQSHEQESSTFLSRRGRGSANMEPYPPFDPPFFPPYA